MMNLCCFFRFLCPKGLVVGGLCMCFLLPCCKPRPSKVELLRREKAFEDSVEYVRAERTIAYSDSSLQLLLPQVDPLLKAFRYEKNEKAEDHGHYVHRLLQTTSNTERNFLQAYVSDDRRVELKSYYFGTQPIHHRSVELSAGEVLIAKEGSPFSFEAEGVHEIVTIEQQDALSLLQFVAEHFDERILVKASGASRVTYYLQENEKKALRDTYQLALLMMDIDRLERAIHTASLQRTKYEKKRLLN